MNNKQYNKMVDLSMHYFYNNTNSPVSNMIRSVFFTEKTEYMPNRNRVANICMMMSMENHVTLTQYKNLYKTFPEKYMKEYIECFEEDFKCFKQNLNLYIDMYNKLTKEEQMFIEDKSSINNIKIALKRPYNDATGV